MGRAGADRRPTRTASGLAIALLSAFSFGLAGPFAAALLAVGWSPLAVALGRLAGTAVLLGVPLALVVARGEHERGRAVLVGGVGGEPEVRCQAHRGGEAPQHADDVELRAAGDVEDEHETRHGQRRTQ